MKSSSMIRTFVWIALSGCLAVTAGFAWRWDDCDGWERHQDWGGKGRFCEIRELNLPVTSSVIVDAGHNGGIGVTGWDRDQIRLEARVQVWKRSEADARAMAQQIEIVTEGGQIAAHGPGGDNWSVSFRLQVPRQTNLDLEAHNGGISIDEVRGTLRAETHNGGLSLRAVAGDVRAQTTNGGVNVELTGSEWQGDGLDVETRNGGVKLSVPDGYSAELETGTVNGRMSINFPVTVQGQIGRSIETTLGEGGAPVRIRTRNGGVTVTHR